MEERFNKSALDILKEEQQLPGIVTLCKLLDNALGLGIGIGKSYDLNFYVLKLIGLIILFIPTFIVCVFTVLPEAENHRFGTCILIFTLQSFRIM